MKNPSPQVHEKLIPGVPDLLMSDCSPGFERSISVKLIRAVVEFPCPSERITDLVEVVRQAAQTGRRGDGLILISETMDIVSIRTGDHDRVALL